MYQRLKQVFPSSSLALLQDKFTFRNSSLTCSSFITFKSTLIYSSEAGTVTATDLINILKSQVAADTTTALTVDGMKLAVLQVGEDQSNNPPALLIGLFFGGVGLLHSSG